MLEAIGSFLSAIKQTSPVVLLAAAIGTGLLIFGSDTFIGALGLVQWRQQYRPYLGVVFLASVSLLVAQGIGRLSRFAYGKWRAGRPFNGLHDTLHSLTPDEKAYLAPFVFGKQNTGRARRREQGRVEQVIFSTV